MKVFLRLKTNIHFPHRLLNKYSGAFLILILFFSSCNEKPDDHHSGPLLVKVTTPDVHEPYNTKSYPSSVQATTEVRLSFRVAGPVDKVLVEEGDRVKKGDLLARLDPRDYIIQLDATEASYERIKNEARRIKNLYERERVSESDYEKALMALEQIRAKRRAHQNALEDTYLRAPFSGQITHIHFDGHEIIDAGLPVLTLSNPEKYEIVTHLPAKDYLKKHDFLEFFANIPYHPDKEIPLELRSVASMPNLNGLYPAYFLPERIPEETLLPGMSIEVLITYREESNDWFSVPASAIFEKNGQAHVWLLDEENQTVSSLEVEIIKTESSGKTLIKAPLKPEDRIIRAGVHKLNEGQEVDPMDPPSETNVGEML